MGDTALHVNGVAYGWGDLRILSIFNPQDAVSAFIPNNVKPLIDQANPFALLRSIQWTEKREVRPLYGKGGTAVGSSFGPFICTGTLKMLLEGYFGLVTMQQIVMLALKAANYLDPGFKMPLSGNLEEFFSLPLLVRYGTDRVTENYEALYGGNLPAQNAIDTLFEFVTLFPAFRFGDVSRSTQVGAASTEVEVGFTCLGRPITFPVPLV